MSEPIRTLGDVGAGHTLGRYELLLPVATGGMAVVWAARLKGTRGFQKIVAVKTIRAEMSDDPRFEQMFLDEAALASRVKHPHVVEILDLGEERDVLYLVMEWIDGEPLHVIMKQAIEKGGIQLPVAVRVASQLCAGLHAAHEVRDDNGKLFGLVHRDVSPQNVLITYGGVAKLVDFGVAKAVERGGFTQGGQVKGKVAYMAPEQARGEVIDRRTDIFALGIVLYSMTTGKHPFRRDNDQATLQNITSDTPAYRPSKLVPAYPKALEDVVMQALEKDPAKRFPTANEMLRALDQALPASMRVSTDEEVASFVRAALGDRYQRRREAIREALRLADERTTDDTRDMKPFRLSIPSISGITAAAAVTETDVSGRGAEPALPDAARWGADGSSGSQSLKDHAGVSRPSGSLLSLPAMAGTGRRAGLSPAGWVAIGALVMAGAATGALITVLRSRPAPAPAAAPSASAPLVAPAHATSSPETAEPISPSALPVASTTPEGEQAINDPGLAPGLAKGSTPPAGHASAARSASTAPESTPGTASSRTSGEAAANTTPANPGSAPTPMVPQIREPGF